MKKVKSIGLIETLGIVGAIEAADTALKAANVECLGYELNKAGYVTIKLSGDVSAVQAAVSSGAATAKRLGNLVATHIIPRPDEQVVNVFIHSADNVPSPAEQGETSGGSRDSGAKESQSTKPIKQAATTTAEKNKPGPGKSQKTGPAKTVESKAKVTPTKPAVAPIDPTVSPTKTKDSSGPKPKK